MRVGNYVRTKNKGVKKIIALYSNAIFDGRSRIEENQIIKSSPNIIDLIEVGDYVNGAKVVRFKTDENGTKWIYTNDENAYGYKSNEIKSIITYEQFKEMEYRIGE